MISLFNDKQKIENFLDHAMCGSLCVSVFSLPISIALLESGAAFAIFFFERHFQFHAVHARPDSKTCNREFFCRLIP